jgi:hypothetical protein
MSLWGRPMVDPVDADGVNEMIAAGVGYWARGLTAEEWQALEALGGGDLHAVIAVGDGDPDDKRLIVWHDRHLSDMLQAVLDIAPGSMAATYIHHGMAHRDVVSGFIDAVDIDSETGDVMLQCWALGEITYG